MMVNGHGPKLHQSPKPDGPPEVPPKIDRSIKPGKGGRPGPQPEYDNYINTGRQPSEQQGRKVSSYSV